MTESIPPAEQPDPIKRFGLSERIEHLSLLISFTGLAITGLPQKYSFSPISEVMIMLMGGIEIVRIIHRICAGILMAAAIYHGGSLTYKLFVLQKPPYLLPSLKDIRDLFDHFRYYLGFSKEHPKMEKFNFEDKAEYWAVVWGTIVMIITGFFMWNPIATTRFLPGEVIPAAKAAHGGEALLAVLAIIIFHLYNVLSQGNLSIFTGFISRRSMKEKHALDLQDIDTGNLPELPAPEVYHKRLRSFIVWSVIVTTILVSGLIWFVTFEQTAITTLPR